MRVTTFAQTKRGTIEKRLFLEKTVVFLRDRKFLSHKTLREDAHLAEMKYMLRIPLGRERVAGDSFSRAEDYSVITFARLRFDFAG